MADLEPLEGNPWQTDERENDAQVIATMAVAFEIARLRQSVDGLRATLSQIKADAEAQRRMHK
jgi:hypothetical protein